MINSLMAQCRQHVCFLYSLVSGGGVGVVVGVGVPVGVIQDNTFHTKITCI